MPHVAVDNKSQRVLALIMAAPVAKKPRRPVVPPSMPNEAKSAMKTLALSGASGATGQRAQPSAVVVPEREHAIARKQPVICLT